MLTKRHITSVVTMSVALGASAVFVSTPSRLDPGEAAKVVAEAAVATSSTAVTAPEEALDNDPMGPVATLVQARETNLGQSDSVVAGPTTSPVGTGVDDPPPEILASTNVAVVAANVAYRSAGADLSLRVSSLPTLAIGESGRIELIIDNVGDADAGSAEISYSLPLGVELSTVSPNPNNCVQVADEITCSISGPVLVDSRATLAIPVTLVVAPPHGGSLADGLASISHSEVSDLESSNDSLTIAPLIDSASQ